MREGGGNLLQKKSPILGYIYNSFRNKCTSRGIFICGIRSFLEIEHPSEGLRKTRKEELHLAPVKKPKSSTGVAMESEGYGLIYGDDVVREGSPMQPKFFPLRGGLPLRLYDKGVVGRQQGYRCVN